MSSDLITRAELADAMANSFGSDVTERLGRDWRRVNTIVAEQGDATFTGEGIDFHMLEFCISGMQHIDQTMPLETGDNGVFDIRPDMLNYHPAGARLHGFAEGLLTLQQIYIDDTVFSDMLPGLIKGDPAKVEMLGFTGLHEPRLRALAVTLLDEARSPGAGGDLYAETIAQQIALILLRRRLAGVLKDPKTFRLSPAQLITLQDLIEAHLEDPLTLDRLATEVGMDTFGFARAFKEATGLAPHQFLIQRRIARIEHLLKATSDTLADIAYATGFASQSHMTATFSKHLGMPPGAYRKAVKS